MVELRAHRDDAAQHRRELIFKISMQKCGSIDAKGGGFDESVDQGSGTNMPVSLFGFRDVLQDIAGCFIDPKNGDAEFGEVEQHASGLRGKKNFRRQVTGIGSKSLSGSFGRGR